MKERESNMGNKFNLDEFRKLLKEAIGDSTQNNFAEMAGISSFNISRLLNNDEVSAPRKSTLLRIADASNGRVTSEQLFNSCGYEVSDNKRVDRDNVDEVVLSLRDGIESASGKSFKYSSIKTMLETLILVKFGNSNIKFQVNVGDDKEYTGIGRNGAERVSNCSITWLSKDFDYNNIFSFAIYYCQTIGGGYIISDCSFDMDTLLELKNSIAYKLLMNLSEKGNVYCEDYPIVLLRNKRVNKSVEERLLKAIFGEDDESDK